MDIERVLVVAIVVCCCEGCEKRENEEAIDRTSKVMREGLKINASASRQLLTLPKNGNGSTCSCRFRVRFFSLFRSLSSS